METISTSAEFRAKAQEVFEAYLDKVEDTAKSLEDISSMASDATKLLGELSELHADIDKELEKNLSNKERAEIAKANDKLGVSELLKEGEEMPKILKEAKSTIYGAGVECLRSLKDEEFDRITKEVNQGFLDISKEVLSSLK